MADNTTVPEKIQIADWIKNNLPNALNILLVIALIWVFLDQKDERAAATANAKLLQETIDNLKTDALKIERERTARMEFLLNNFPKSDATPK